MKRLEEKTSDQVVPKPFSQRTEGGVWAKNNQVNPRIDHNLSLEETLSVITMVKKVTLKEIVRLGRTRKRKIGGTKDPKKMKIPQPV